MRDTRTTVSRRRLLQGVGGLTAALTAPVWRPATVFAAAAAPPRRFVGIFSANGTIPTAFFPASASGTALSLGPATPILEPLAKYQSQMLVLKGVNMESTVGANKPGGPHMKGPGAMLTGGTLLPGSFTGSGGPAGYADRISVDQLIANRLGTKTRFPSLEFGVRIEGQEPLRFISYRGANMPNQAVDDPWQIYARIFGGADLSSQQLAQALAEKKSVLDFLKGDLTRLSARFAAADRARLEGHLAGIRRIETQLTAMGTNVCAKPTLPAKLDTRAMANYPTVGRLQTDLMVLALTCGMTNVATFMWANADSWQYYPWIGVNEEHHELSHAADNDSVARDKLIKINRWHAEQLLYLLDQLAAATDSDGSSVLANTLVLWGNELGAGNTHTHMDIPWVVAGGSGGHFKMGRSLQFKNQPHNNLLVSVCNAMGLDDVTTFGDPATCTGPLAGLTA
jgi:hypothetical protein